MSKFRILRFGGPQLVIRADVINGFGVKANRLLLPMYILSPLNGLILAYAGTKI